MADVFCPTSESLLVPGTTSFFDLPAVEPVCGVLRIFVQINSAPFGMNVRFSDPIAGFHRDVEVGPGVHFFKVPSGATHISALGSGTVHVVAGVLA